MSNLKTSPITKNGSGATNKDVARVANVSVMTVSRVLNGNAPVKESTRKRVLDACKTLGYRPNLAAATLSNGKSRVIGVIVPHFALQFYTLFVQTVTGHLSKSGYHVIPVYGQHGEPGEQNMRITPEQIEFLVSRQVDGVIVMSNIGSKGLDLLNAAGIPVVFVDMHPDDLQYSYVGTQDFEGAKTITEYLIGMGHRKIAFLGGAKGIYTADQRTLGYKTALTEHGIEFDEDLTWYGGFDLQWGCTGISAILDRTTDFTAVFAVTDYLAIGAISTLVEKGYRVPDDISIAGFTGDEIGMYTVPALTTMRQPVKQMGIVAADMIMNASQADDIQPCTTLLHASFVERKSVRRISE